MAPVVEAGTVAAVEAVALGIRTTSQSLRGILIPLSSVLVGRRLLEDTVYAGWRRRIHILSMRQRSTAVAVAAGAELMIVRLVAVTPEMAAEWGVMAVALIQVTVQEPVGQAGTPVTVGLAPGQAGQQMQQFPGLEEVAAVCPLFTGLRGATVVVSDY